ncbi:MAG: hypothetical protein LBD97_05530 [Bifidobacteriaceae bacterium]|nr:hypothetical protein [Bifidobacteriaceae bacterium]
MGAPPTRRQRAAFDEHGYDPRLGKVPVEDLLAAWLEQREGKVTQATLDTDRYLHHLGDYADRTALQLLNANTATPQQAKKPTSERPSTRKLAPISAFGQGPAPASGPGRSLSR